MTKRLIATGDDPAGRQSIWTRWDGDPLSASRADDTPDKIIFTGFNLTAPVMRECGDDSHIVLPNRIIDLLKRPGSGWSQMPLEEMAR